ncbi:MAG: hypothetical protein LBP35_01060 [Candidatus Ancillula trichonymphae]|jgi:hypothetical protein|nr:hypothetical protein [Candidatus Ancillula trichonymphae]
MQVKLNQGLDYLESFIKSTTDAVHAQRPGAEKLQLWVIDSAKNGGQPILSGDGFNNESESWGNSKFQSLAAFDPSDSGILRILLLKQIWARRRKLRC